MEFHFEESLKKTYRIETPERIATPRLVLFQAELECNITKIRRSLKEIAPDYGLHALWPHVKTHKSHWVVEKLLRVGIGGFKATPNEVEMLVKAGAKSIFVAYPLLPPDVEKLGRLITENREIRFYVQISQHDHVEHLLAAAHGVNIKWSYLLDLDVGMHRTGMAPENALAFYNSLPLTPQLQFAGLHAYDGHNHSQELEKRRIESLCTLN